jgi:hypothetical protein
MRVFCARFGFNLAPLPHPTSGGPEFFYEFLREVYAQVPHPISTGTGRQIYQQLLVDVKREIPLTFVEDNSIMEP